MFQILLILETKQLKINCEYFIILQHNLHKLSAPMINI